jgi:uncharacterized protein YdeI (YjbR/CyaY-like superfamily)
MAATEEPIVELPDQQAWSEWLEEHGESASGVWLKIAKKGAPRTTVNHPQALETAICHGWIDARRNRLDEHFFLQRFTPRGPRSKWSQVNREKAEQLIAEGRMRSAGLRAVQAAQADGRWDDAYPAQSQAPVPEDLQAALDAQPQAKAFFETLTGTRRYAFLYRLHHVKEPQRRQQRIAHYIELLSARQTLN